MEKLEEILKKYQKPKTATYLTIAFVSVCIGVYIGFQSGYQAKEIASHKPSQEAIQPAGFDLYEVMPELPEPYEEPTTLNI